jgi:hypothetical protein
VPPNAPQLVDLQVKVAGIPNLTGPTAIHRAFNWAIEDGLLTSANPASGGPIAQNTRVGHFPGG